MKTVLSLFLVSFTAFSLSACGGIAPCNDELDNCSRGGAFSEERTAKAAPKPKPAPAPEPVVVKKPKPAPVVVERPAPQPAPTIVDDTPVMQSAEPQFTTVSK
ncbi:MAG: hypothetical protein AAF549_02930 [Pseudomonadota bacterium]